MLNLAVAVKTGKKRVFNWSQRRAWERVFRHLLADKISDAVIEEACRINPRSIADDNFAWLDSVVATVTRQRLEQIPTLLAQRLSDYYDFIIAFHGTRLESASPFLDHGMKPSNAKLLEQRAIELFGNEEAVQNAILELRQSGYEGHNHGKINLSLTREVFFGSCKGYLLEGSEYIATIANRLRQSDKLGAIGRPLIVECLIPANFVTSEFWRARSYAMLEDCFKRLLRPSEKHHIEPSYAVVTEPIPAENILRVHEFTEVKHPCRELNPYTGATDAWAETTFRPFKIWLGHAQR